MMPHFNSFNSISAIFFSSSSVFFSPIIFSRPLLSFSKDIKDRFGELPNEIYRLYDALRIKWLGKKLGFTRVILKDNTVRAYLPDESNNIFYKSSNFTKILTFVKENFKTTKMIKKRNKLSILVEDVQKIENAVLIFKNLYDN